MGNQTLQQLAEKILADPAFRASDDFKRIQEKAKHFADFLLQEAHGDSLCAFGLLSLLRKDSQIQEIPQFGKEQPNEHSSNSEPEWHSKGERGGTKGEKRNDQ